ncbi:hypothetical protein GcM3_016022, partial [Golovinomyces cichoracearum]
NHAIKANQREQFERQNRRQKKDKEREVLDTISDTTQRSLNSKSIPKASIPFAQSSKRESETKLRNTVGSEGNGLLDYKKMFENTMITITKPVWNLEPKEEELLVEASSSLVKVGGHRETEPEQNGDKLKIDCLTVSSPKIPTVDLMTTPIIRTTARKDRAFRIPGEVLATRDGKTGKFYLDESMICADQESDMVLISPQLVHVINTQAITMGTADGTSHRITEWVSFVFITRGIQRQVCAFVRPERYPTLDLFLLLGLPLLHNVKAVIEIYRPQIKIGEPTQIPFKNALKTEQFERKEKALESYAKEIMTRANFEKCGRILGNNLNSKESTHKIFDKQSNKKFDDISFSSETEDSITVDGSDYEEDQAINDYKSASTYPDVSDE